MQVWKSEVQSGKMCTGGKYKENASTATQGWKKQVWKIKVRVSRDGKCKYGKIEYRITVQL